MLRIRYCKIVDAEPPLRGPFFTREEAARLYGETAMLVLADPRYLTAFGKERIIEDLDGFLEWTVDEHDVRLLGPDELVPPVEWAVRRDPSYGDWAVLGPFQTLAEAVAGNVNDGHPADRGEVVMLVRVDPARVTPAHHRAIVAMVADALEAQA